MCDTILDELNSKSGMELLKKLDSIELTPQELNVFTVGPRTHLENRVSDLMRLFMGNNVANAWLARALIRCLCKQYGKK